MNKIKFYLDELANKNNVLQLMIFGDDSVEIQFKDHSLLQLSPCGANYQYSRSSHTGPAIAEQQKLIRQRCRFATSETKDKVDTAIRFRNHFAQRPYLPSQFIHLCEGGSSVSLYKEVVCYQWPDSNTMCGIAGEEGESILIEDKNEHANLRLDTKHGFVVVDFLTTLSPCTSRETTPNQSPREVKQGKVVLASKPKREYIRLQHFFTIQSCPETWKYPFGLAMKAAKNQCDISGVRSLTPYPKPLPSVCKKQFKHIWRSFINTEDISKSTQYTTNVKLKFLWTNNVSFWLSTKTNEKCPTTNHITIWLNDGSVINSHSIGKYYFRHTNLPPKEPNYIKETERIYSPTSLPMNAALKATILRAIRLLTYQEQDNEQGGNSEICWQGATGLSSSLEEQLKEIYQDESTNIGSGKDELSVNVSLPSLGNFSAYGGSIQIKYKDGTIVHCAVKEKQLVSLKTSSSELSEILCRILHTNGQYAVCHDLTLPGSQLSPYVKPLCDWLGWLAKSPDERTDKPFYSDTIYAPQKSDMIHSELEKINRFNYLCQNHSTLSHSSPENSGSLENNTTSSINSFNSLTGSFTSHAKEFNHAAPQSVERVLKNTNSAIADIDSFIAEFRCNMNNG